MRPIAIIGASCRFPGANGLEEFWQLLREGRNAVGTVPLDRWDPDALYSSDPDAPGKITTRHGAFIPNIKEFDCGFFGISPREAATMDPQQRLLLETAYEAFEDAGLPMETLAGSQTGVYVGIGPGDYGRMCAQAWARSAHIMPPEIFFRLQRIVSRIFSICVGQHGHRYGVLIFAGGSPSCLSQHRER